MTPGSRPCAPDAKARGRCLENRHWACRTNKECQASKEPLAAMKKPFAWVSQDALGTNLARRPGAPDYLEAKRPKLGLALVVQRPRPSRVT